jgi:DNA-binding transcriptional MerR regulator
MAKTHPNSVVADWFTLDQAARHAQLSKDMVNYLCRYSIVKPTGCVKRGRGCVRKYTFTDILLLRVIAKLLSNGISALRLRKSLIALQKRGGSAHEILLRKYLVTDGKSIYLQDNNVLELLTTGQLAFVFVLELESVRKELSQKITRGKK